MAKSRETALYYDPEGGERAQQVKTVLVCMGARIKNIAAADFAQTVGFTLGRAGFAQCADTAEAPEQPMLSLSTRGRRALFADRRRKMAGHRAERRNRSLFLHRKRI